MKAKDYSSKEMSDDFSEKASGGYDYHDRNPLLQARFKFTSDETDKLRSLGYDMKPARVYTRGDLNEIFRTGASNSGEMQEILKRKGFSGENIRG